MSQLSTESLGVTAMPESETRICVNGESVGERERATEKGGEKAKESDRKTLTNGKR